MTQLDLFKNGTLQERFLEFHKKNPHVYRTIVKMARQAKQRGYQKIGMQMILEVMRWNRMMRTNTTAQDGDFKLNNNYGARYARLVMEQEHDLKGIFETRLLKAK